MKIGDVLAHVNDVLMPLKSSRCGATFQFPLSFRLNFLHLSVSFFPPLFLFISSFAYPYIYSNANEKDINVIYFMLSVKKSR